MSLDFDASQFYRFLEQQRAAVLDAAISGVHDATDHLLATSRDIAPLKTNTLRVTAGKEVEAVGGRIIGEVFYSATEESQSGVRFNYALRVHEMGQYKNPTTAGTRPKFLSQPLKTNQKLYQQMINDAVRRVLA